MSPNFFTNTVTIKNEDNTTLGTYPISDITSSCSGTTGWAQFKIPNLGDGNTWAAVQTFSGYNNWDNLVLWYGTVYSRTN